MLDRYEQGGDGHVQRLFDIQSYNRDTRDFPETLGRGANVGFMLVHCRDTDPTLNRHWFYISCAGH